MIIIMMVILVLILLSLFLPFIDAATACIGGYEGPDANGLCTECPVGKASGDATWKFTVNSDKCVDVPTTCGPGQFIYAYSGGYFYCSNAYQNQYCPNGRCLVDSRNGYTTGVNSCPGPNSNPRSDEILINDAEPSNNNFPDNVYVSPNPSNTPINAQYTYSEVVVYSSDSSLNTGGAIMCTELNTDHCPPGTGNWGSGINNGVSTSSPSYRSIITDNPNFLNSGVGQVGCYNCTAGTFQSGIVGTGRTFCQTCGPNQYSPARATSCTTNTCAAGYGYVAPSTHTYENELHACKACDAGYYNDGTFLACRQCPVGKASSGQASKCVDVELVCDPGQYLTIFNDKSVCSDVPIDYYCFNGRCLLDCSNIASSSSSSYGYTSSCKGLTGNACNPTYKYLGPRATKTGAMACTSSNNTHIHVPSDCPPGSFGFGNGFTFGCYPCEAGTSRAQSDALTSCSPCSVGLVAGKGSGTCNDVCPTGKGIAKKSAVSCTRCPEGYVNLRDESSSSTDNLGISKMCTTCPTTYQYGDKFAATCLDCPYPYQSIIDETDGMFYNKYLSCQVINFRTYQSAVTAVQVFMVVLFFGSLLFVRNIPEGKEKKQLDIRHAFGLCIYIAIPALDTLTDIAYLMTSNFYNYAIFGLILVLVIVPNFYFLVHLWKVGARLRLFIPMPKFLILPKYDSLFKILFTGIASIPWLILNSPFWIPWLTFGFFLHATKTMAIGGIHNMWVQVWTGSNKFDVDHIIDVEVLNESIYMEVLLETIPQLVLQISNNVLLKQPWTGVSIFSVILSGLNALNVTYKLIYYKYYQKMELSEIPVEIKVLGVEIIKLEPPEISKMEIHELNHLHHHKTTEVLDKLLDCVDNTKIVHDNIKTLKDDVQDVRSHLKATKSSKHFIDVVDDRIHTVMVDVDNYVKVIDETIEKMEEEVENLREDLTHVKQNGDWSEKYKAKHGERLSVHYHSVPTDVESDNKIADINKEIKLEEGEKDQK